ncbi:hypothetical protein [Nesterenkonia ebinurensis]|uniref:hypothetical protein n=1 Tax=Nesterenkonia ebinurensis TaxID=2608252 RepID=UPI00123D057E|nr:hypothetical protein [Nesterenkonia ebinurensis]
MSRRKKKPRGNPRGSTAKRRSSSSRNAERRTVAQQSMQAARYLWAVVTGLVIAALLFEPTMIWTLGVGVFMVANAELIGLWLVVAGYGMACLPATFGLLIATGRFWFSLTHALWIGALYSVTGFLLLDRIMGLLSPYGFP